MLKIIFKLSGLLLIIFMVTVSLLIMPKES